MTSRNLILLAVALPVAAGGAWLLLDGARPDGAVAPVERLSQASTESVSESRAEEPELETPGRPFPQLDPRSDEEAREVVVYCDDAQAVDIPNLRAVALAATDPLVAGNAVQALGRLGAFANDEELVPLTLDSRSRVRQESIVALGLSQDVSAVVTLESLLAREDMMSERPLILQALGRIGGRQSRAVLSAWAPKANDVEKVFLRDALANAERVR